jgi:lipoyl(octanoyl) transferase
MHLPENLGACVNTVLNHTVKVIDLGMIDYKEAWDYQERLFKQTVATKIENRRKPEAEQVVTPNYLLFCQHPHVYTLGKSGKEENLLVNDLELEALDATYYKINRGGDITYHGPGQIVCYPIIDLVLEEAVIQTCASFGVTSGRIEGLTGVWINDPVNPRKIAAMGVKSSRWVTMHGLSFNVNTDLAYFSKIIPCGIDDKAVTSLEIETKTRQDIGSVQDILTEQLMNLFKMEEVK